MIQLFVFIVVIIMVISSSKKKNQGNMRNANTPPGSPLPNANVTKINPYPAAQNPQMTNANPYAAKPNPQMTGTNLYTAARNSQTAGTNTYSPHSEVQFNNNNNAFHASPVNRPTGNRPKDFSEYPSFTEAGVPVQPVRRQSQTASGKNTASATVSKRTQPQTKKLNKIPSSESMTVTPVPAEAEPARPTLVQSAAFVDFYQPPVNFSLSSIDMEGTLYIPNEPSGLLMGISEYNSEFGGI